MGTPKAMIELLKRVRRDVLKRATAHFGVLRGQAEAGPNEQDEFAATAPPSLPQEGGITGLMTSVRLPQPSATPGGTGAEGQVEGAGKEPEPVQWDSFGSSGRR
jgi:hypothetical protein